MPINLDIELLWRNLQSDGLELDLSEGGRILEAVPTESRAVFLIERFLEKGTLQFSEQEEFLELIAWWQESLGEWTGQNAQYCSQLFVLMEKIKQRLRI